MICIRVHLYVEIFGSAPVLAELSAGTYACVRAAHIKDAWFSHNPSPHVNRDASASVSTRDGARFITTCVFYNVRRDTPMALNALNTPTLPQPLATTLPPLLAPGYSLLAREHRGQVMFQLQVP